MGARILVVDDSIYDRQLVSQCLREAGHDVVGLAASGPEAVDLYQELRPDVVTTDLVLPYLSGPDLARRIRAQDPRARIIAVTGLSQPSVQAEAMAAGMCGFVAKPVDPAELLSEIAEALAP